MSSMDKHQNSDQVHWFDAPHEQEVNCTACNLIYTWQISKIICICLLQANIYAGFEMSSKKKEKKLLQKIN